MAKHGQVETQVLSCVECRRRWSDPAERWRVYLTDDDEPDAVVYCDRCAEREFGIEASPPQVGPPT